MLLWIIIVTIVRESPTRCMSQCHANSSYLNVPGSQFVIPLDGSCDVTECQATRILYVSAQFSNYTSKVCQDMKAYIHCLTRELKGCVGSSWERTTLQILANVFYTSLLSLCDYHGSNGVCDSVDCVFVADVTEGFSPIICRQLNKYLQCLEIEYQECGRGTIHGLKIDDELEAWRHDANAYCGGCTTENIPGTTVITFVYIIITVII